MHSYNYLNDLTRILFNIIFILLMVISCFWIVQPFIISFSWASMVVIATWPLFIKVQYLLWNQRFIAIIFMILLLLLLFILPIFILVNNIMHNCSSLITWITQSDVLSLKSFNYLQDIPVIGQKIFNTWKSFIYNNELSLITKAQPYIGKITTWLLNQIFNLSNLFLNCVLMILFSILLYLRGEKVALLVNIFAQRISANRGVASILLAVHAIRTVALGVVLTAIIQAILSGISLAIIGIPISNILTIVIFLLCIAQLGPLPILIPIVIWLYYNGNINYCIALLVWSIMIVILDNILRSILINKEIDLPILLMLCGVLGGVLAFGMIGLFVGPIVLVVSWRLIYAWIKELPSNVK